MLQTPCCGMGSLHLESTALVTHAAVSDVAADVSSCQALPIPEPSRLGLPTTELYRTHLPSERPRCCRASCRMMAAAMETLRLSVKQAACATHNAPSASATASSDAPACTALFWHSSGLRVMASTQESRYASQDPASLGRLSWQQGAHGNYMYLHDAHNNGMHKHCAVNALHAAWHREPEAWQAASRTGDLVAHDEGRGPREVNRRHRQRIRAEPGDQHLEPAGTQPNAGASRSWPARQCAGDNTAVGPVGHWEHAGRCCEAFEHPMRGLHVCHAASHKLRHCCPVSRHG